MDVLTVVSAVVLAFGGESSLLSSGPLPAILAAEQVPVRNSHPLFPLLETPTENTGSAQETPPSLEPGTGTSEPHSDGPNAPIFVPFGTANLPQNDPSQDPLFVPLSPNPIGD